MRYQLFNILFGFLFILLSGSNFAQYNSFVTYTLENGLPSNTAYYVFKDVDDYLWITTDKGVVKYDGYSFTTYTTTEGLSDNEIFEAFQDSKKRIWFSTYNGIPTVYSNKLFYSTAYLFKQRNIEPVGPTYRISETPEALWILNRKSLYKVSNNQIYTFDAKNKNFVTMAYNKAEKKMVALFAGSNMAISIGNNNRVDTIRFSTPYTTGISKSIIKEKSIFYTSWKALCMWNLETNTGNYFVLESEILSIVDSDNDSMVIVGTATDVFEFNIKTEKWSNKFINQPEITSVYVDANKSYWSSSLNSGVSFFGNEKMQVLSNKNILPFGYVSLVRKMGNRLLIASDKFRFCVYNISTKKVETYFDENGIIPGRGFANAIRMANNGDIYVSFRIVILKIDKLGNVTNLALNQVAYDFIYTPKYYFALHTDQISRREASASITQLSNDFESMQVNARHLFFDETSNSIYAYGASGLYKVNVDSFNRVQKFRQVAISGNVSAFTKFNDSLFVVGTTVNGIHFLKNNQIIASMSATEGLASNYVHCILVNKNEIWIGTDRGIDVLNIDLKSKKIQMKYVGKNDGIFNHEVNDIYIENDTVYAATPSGLFFFNKKDINKPIEKPILNLEHIKFNAIEQELQSSNKLRSSRKNVKIKFTGISYGSLGNIVYRYKLNPTDEIWHITSSREVEYPNLSPGDYTFSIQCKGVRGGWSDLKTINFEITPSFWQRIEVRILIFLLIVLVIGIIIRTRIRALRKRHGIKEKLLQLENEKLESDKNQAIKDREIIELEQQSLRLHMNPHFIFNAINAIQGFYAGNEVSKAKEFISYFSKLLRSILETSKEKLIPVSIEIDILKSYLKLFLLRFEDKYEYEITVDPNIDIEECMIPPMVVQPFVENAVLHGISPLKTKGKISINFELEDDILKISIQDNGIGRKKSDELKMFSKSKSTGIKVTQMRLKNIDTQLNIRKNVEIIDLEEDGISMGTLVILRVPLSPKT